MNEINYEEFINPTDVRYYLHKPFCLGGRKIYTDGHTLVFHPTDEPDSVPEGLENSVPKILEKIEAADTWCDLPQSSLETEPCLRCNSSGKVTEVDCAECDGEGEVEWSTANHVYTAECKECYGDLQVIKPGGDTKCTACDGKGQRFRDRSIPIFQSNFNPHYVARINKPGTEIQLPGPDSMLIFRNGDTKGAIMPMRV